MWHVDEGALHAYLDGALDEYPAAEALRVREHLEACADCAGRLEEERRVREEAESILGLAAPRVEVPSFEELRAYVRAQQPPRTAASLRLHRLTWAASVVLALGTGWLLRGEVPPTSVASGPSEAARDALVEEAARFEAAAAPATQTEGQADEAPAEAERPGTSASGAAFTDAADPAAPRANLGSSAPERQRRAGPTTPAAPTEPLRELATDRVASGAGNAAASGLADARGLDEVANAVTDPEPADELAARQQSVAPEPAPPTAAPAPNAAEVVRLDTLERETDDVRAAAPEQRLTSAVTAPATLEPLGAQAGGRVASADALPDVDAVALVVPGLDVLDVLPVGQGTTFAGMRALQRLDRGDTLEIVHLPENVDPTSLPPLREGWRELLLPRGSGWLVMRAPVSEAALLELLQRLESGR